MILEGFIQGTSDEELLKSLPTENISEDLVKAMNKAGLVQKEVQVKGKNGQTFTRKQWVKASDVQSTEPASQSKQVAKDEGDKKNSTKAPAKGYVMEFKTGSTYEYLYTEKPTLTSAKEAYERFHGKPAPKYSTATKHGNQIKIDSDTVKNHCVNISGNDYITSSELSSSKQQDSQPDKGGYKNGSVDKDGNLVAGDKSSLTDLVEEITGTGMFDAKDLADEKISSELQKTSHYDGHFIESMEYESARLVGNKVEIHGRVYGDIDLDDGDKEPFDKTVTFSIPVKSSKSAAPSNASTQDKDKINHNTGVQDKPKSSMLEDYFTGNHGHSDSKSALVALLGKGYSRQDIMSQAEKSGVTWKKNDHEGINWMRASMAIQKAWKKG